MQTQNHLSYFSMTQASRQKIGLVEISILQREGGTIASYFELTEDECQLLIEALEHFKTHQGTYSDEETLRYKDLKHYLETRERLE